MKMSTLIIIAVAAVIINFYVRSWQCAEMFPDANRLACMLWK